MPLLHIQTNVSVDDKPALMAKASQLTAEILGKPESYVMVKISDRCDMLFAGSADPLAYVEFKSLGLPIGQSSDYSHRLCQFLEDELGIDPARIYIEFTVGERALWGWNKGTF